MSVEHRLDVFTSVGAPCVRCHMGMALVWDSHGDPENEDAWEGICLRCTREEMNQLRGIAFTILTQDGRDLGPYVTLPIRSKWFAAREGAVCVKCNERAYVSRLGVIGGLCLDLCRPCAVEGAQRFVDLLSEICADGPAVGRFRSSARQSCAKPSSPSPGWRPREPPRTG